MTQLAGGMPAHGTLRRKTGSSARRRARRLDFYLWLLAFVIAACAVLAFPSRTGAAPADRKGRAASKSRLVKKVAKPQAVPAADTQPEIRWKIPPETWRGSTEDAPAEYRRETQVALK